MAVPLYLCRVPAGFPSPAGDYVESRIDFNEWLVRNEPATFVVRVEGDSMESLIRSGDWLVVDRSLEPRHRDVVVAFDSERKVRLMETVDRINRRHGSRAVRPLGAGLDRRWEMRRASLSGRYTTRLDEVLMVKAS